MVRFSFLRLIKDQSCKTKKSQNHVNTFTFDIVYVKLPSLKCVHKYDI